MPSMAAGKLVSLHVVKADDPLNDPSVSWSIVQGEETKAAPVFDGSDAFTVDARGSGKRTNCRRSLGWTLHGRTGCRTSYGYSCSTKSLTLI